MSSERRRHPRWPPPSLHGLRHKGADYGRVETDQWLTDTFPPSTTRCVPVMKDAFGLSRKATA
jgi:hypothetical protein